MLLKNEHCQWSSYLLQTVKHEVSELGGIGDTKAAQSSGECKQVPLLICEGTSTCESWQEFVANGVLQRLKRSLILGIVLSKYDHLLERPCHSSICCMWLATGNSRQLFHLSYPLLNLACHICLHKRYETPMQPQDVSVLPWLSAHQYLETVQQPRLHVPP